MGLNPISTTSSAQSLSPPDPRLSQDGDVGAVVMNMLKQLGGNDTAWKVKVKVLTSDRVSPERSSDEGHSRESSPAIPIRRGRSSSTPLSAYSQNSSETATTSTPPSTSTSENNSEDNSDTSLMAVSPRSKSTIMSQASSPENSYSQSFPIGRSLSSFSSKEVVSRTILSDEELGMQLLGRIHEEKIKSLIKRSWGLRSYGQVPRIELHKHLEGSFAPHTLEAWVKDFRLYYDEDRKVFRRKPKRSKPQEGQTTQGRSFYTDKGKGDDWLTQLIKNNSCVKFDAETPKKNRKQFNETFKFIGSITDRVPLSEQIKKLYKKALEMNIKLNEWMFGIYFVPVPEKFTLFVQSKLQDESRTPEEITGAIEECWNYLFQSENVLGVILEDHQKEKFRKKLEVKYSTSQTTNSSEKDEAVDFDTLMKMTYPQAFKRIMDKELSQLDNKWFDPKEPITAKLIFEVMRHYGLHEFFAWAVGAFSYIQQDNYKVVGVTVDGPEDEENSKKFFLTQCEIIKYLRVKYPKVRVTYHGLEFDESEYKDFQTTMGRDVDIFGTLLKCGDRIGHASSTEQTKNQLENLRLAREKFVEICLSTVRVTTGRDFSDIPLKDLFNEGVPVGVFTDDPGIVKTDLIKELILAIETYELSPDDVKVMLQSSYEHAFLEGEGIYDIRHVKDNKKLNVKRLRYDFKEKYQSYISDPTKTIDEITSPKAQKQIQFERDWNEFLRTMKTKLSLELRSSNSAIPSDSSSSDARPFSQ